MTVTTGNVSGRSVRSNIGRWVAGGLAVAFGIATIAEGGHVLFGGPEARAEKGNIVPFVLMFNFGAGFAYVAAGAATLIGRTWAVWLARALAISTLMIFIAFGVHVLQGGAFEKRTVMALTMRTLFWAVQSFVLPALLRKEREQ